MKGSKFTLLASQISCFPNVSNLSLQVYIYVKQYVLKALSVHFEKNFHNPIIKFHVCIITWYQKFVNLVPGKSHKEGQILGYIFLCGIKVILIFNSIQLLPKFPQCLCKNENLLLSEETYSTKCTVADFKFPCKVSMSSGAMKDFQNIFHRYLTGISDNDNSSFGK